jgi:hypothetical protein
MRHAIVFHRMPLVVNRRLFVALLLVDSSLQNVLFTPDTLPQLLCQLDSSKCRPGVPLAVLRFGKVIGVEPVDYVEEYPAELAVHTLLDNGSAFDNRPLGFQCGPG